MLTITLLGTAATMPLPDRALSTAFAACGGHGLLFDCGEGTQAAARRAGVNGQVLGAPTARYYWPSATIREFAAVLWEHRVLNLAMIVLLAVLALLLSGLPWA